LSANVQFEPGMIVGFKRSIAFTLNEVVFQEMTNACDRLTASTIPPAPYCFLQAKTGVSLGEST